MLTVTGSGELNVYGNWTNQNAASSSICGKVAFKGTSAQTIAGVNTFCKLEVNNAAGITHTGNTVITGELVLTAGNFRLGNNDLTLSAGATVTGGSATSYVETGNVPGSGPFLIKPVTAAASLFPVGNSNYTPATIVNNGPQTNFSIRCFENVLQNGTSGNPIVASGKIIKTWVINPANVNTIADITLQWNGVNNDGLDVTNCFVSKNKGGPGQNWEALSTGDPAQGTDPYSRTATNVTSFSKFSVFSNATILPVNILSFSGYVTGMQANLSWKVANQKNIRTYDIKKSFDGQVFSQIGEVMPQNSTGVVEYNFTDLHFDKPSYYRIISTDVDGSKKQSIVVYLSTTLKPNRVFSITPNPVKGNFKLVASRIQTEPVTAILIAANGRKLASVSNTLENVNISLNQQLLKQAPGIYFLQVISAEDHQVLRVIKQ